MQTSTASSGLAEINRCCSLHAVSVIHHALCRDSLVLKATRGVTIALVSSLERKRRQPGLATDGPEFVGWLQLVRGIQRSQVHFDFVCGACENGRAAAGTEKPPGVVARFAFDRHRILREYRGSVKKGPMLLAAVETVTKADPVWASRRHNSDVAAQATAGESVHAASPLKASGWNDYNQQLCHCNCPLMMVSGAGGGRCRRAWRTAMTGRSRSAPLADNRASAPHEGTPVAPTNCAAFVA